MGGGRRQISVYTWVFGTSESLCEVLERSGVAQMLGRSEIARVGLSRWPENALQLRRSELAVGEAQKAVKHFLEKVMLGWLSYRKNEER